jgi:hypothetical protein
LGHPGSAGEDGCCEIVDRKRVHHDLGRPISSEELADLVGAERAVADQGDSQGDAKCSEELNEFGQSFKSNGGCSS